MSVVISTNGPVVGRLFGKYWRIGSIGIAKSAAARGWRAAGGRWSAAQSIGRPSRRARSESGSRELEFLAFHFVPLRLLLGGEHGDNFSLDFLCFFWTAEEC